MIRKFHFSAAFESGTRWETQIEESHEMAASVQAKIELEHFAASEDEPIERLVSFDLVFVEPPL